MLIYLDNAASAPVRKCALEAAMPFFTECYGNPSSEHSQGRRAKLAIIKAREQCAEAIGAKPSEIIFTSGGTESDNLAVKSAARIGAGSGKRHIVTTAIEHPAVLNSCKALCKEGFRLTILPVSSDGFVSVSDVEKALRPDTALVSVMAANNEIGTVQPTAQIGGLCASRGIPFHTDAVQAAGNIELDVNRMNIDLLSVSAHKLGGLKGTGFLYCADRLALPPLIDGGGQENGMRSGTENPAGIAALGSAMEEVCRDIRGRAMKTAAMRDELISLLLQIPDSRLNGGGERLCGCVNISFRGIEGESLVLNLDMRGICASSASACAGGSTLPSHVLTALGTDEEYIKGSLRLTLSDNNTVEEIRTAAEIIKDVVGKLRYLRGSLA